MQTRMALVRHILVVATGLTLALAAGALVRGRAAARAPDAGTPSERRKSVSSVLSAAARANPIRSEHPDAAFIHPGDDRRRLLARDVSGLAVVAGAVLLVSIVVRQPAVDNNALASAVFERSAVASMPVTVPRPVATATVQPRDANPRGPIPAALALALTRTPAPPETPQPPPRETSYDDRMALLHPCSTQPDCFVYVVRRGDNLRSIANWFGIPYATLIALNPDVENPAVIHADERLRLPRPRR